MGIIGRIDNLDVLCRDVDAMVAFYHGVLGFDLFLPYEPGSGWAAVQCGDVTVYILATPVTRRAPRRTPVTEENAPGIDSFAFAVTDLEAAIAGLDGKVEWAGPAELWEHPGGTYYRHRAFYDPEGNLLHLTEPHKVTPAGHPLPAPRGTAGHVTFPAGGDPARPAGQQRS